MGTQGWKELALFIAMRWRHAELWKVFGCHVMKYFEDYRIMMTNHTVKISCHNRDAEPQLLQALLACKSIPEASRW